MPDNRNWQTELDEYIRLGEPTKTERSDAWKTAIGLQDVDGLKTSEYLLNTAKEHIEGRINIADAQARIQSYYEQSDNRHQIEDNTKEADIVSSRIAALLGEKTFQFSPAEYKEIHRRLFSGIFEHAGRIRPYNITKNEWVLSGETVIYAPFDSINTTLDYDFKTEKEFSHNGLSVNESVRHIAKFASDIWQIHPFCEGNTRTTAVFIIKYLRSFGFGVNNDVFAENSWYFRNALVRANYYDLSRGITATTEFLERFFENLLLGKQNELKNRILHIDFQSANTATPKSQCGTLVCALDELALIQAMENNPNITQIELANVTGLTERTIKRRTVVMQEKGLIRRLNGKRNGKWEILVELDKR